MRKLLTAGILAAITTLGASAAMAQQYQRWSRDVHPYERRHHSVCQQKAQRLHNYERRAARDGRITQQERRNMRQLERDLDRTCGRYRYR